MYIISLLDLKYKKDFLESNPNKKKIPNFYLRL